MIFVYSIRDMFVCSLAKTFGHLSDRWKNPKRYKALTMEHYIRNKVFVSPFSRPLSDRSARYNRGFFIKHKRKLTTLPILRYSSGHRKGRLKILSMNTATASANVGTGEKGALPDFARAYGAGPAEAENAGHIVVPHNNNTDCEKRHERFRLRFRLRRYHHGLRCLRAHRRAIYANGSPPLFRRLSGWPRHAFPGHAGFLSFRAI